MFKDLLSPRILFFFLFLTLTIFPAFAEDLPDPVQNILSLYQSKDPAQGDLALKAFEAENPQSPHLAMLWLTAGRAQTSLLQAVPCFRKVTESFPDSPQAPLAQIEMAQMHFVCGNVPTAAAEARRFLAIYPRHERKLDALLLLGAIDTQAGRIRSAANRYAEATVLCSDSPRVAEAYVGLGDCKFRMDDLTGAKEAYYKALDKGTAILDVGKVYYQLGLIAQKRNRIAESRRYFMLLARHYPHSRYSKLAAETLASLEETRGSGAMNDQLLAPLSLPRATFSVKTAAFDTREKADKFSQRFTKAGHKVTIHQRNDRFMVMVGRFSSEMDAFFFAEQLQKKFGVKTEIISLEQ
jgi:tetratricopeptide (TPR) repeat protein